MNRRRTWRARFSIVSVILSSIADTQCVRKQTSAETEVLVDKTSVLIRSTNNTVFVGLTDIFFVATILISAESKDCVLLECHFHGGDLHLLWRQRRKALISSPYAGLSGVDNATH